MASQPTTKIAALKARKLAAATSDALRHISRSEFVFASLRDAIWEGRFAPGERIPEEEIAHSLGVSRTPVRDALRRLQERGMPCPTLVVWGYDDPAADLKNGMQLIGLFMKKQLRTEVRIFNRSGHFVMREHPAAFNRLIDTYVEANR